MPVALDDRLSLDVVTFAAGGHRYGIEASRVSAQRPAAGDGRPLLQIGDRLIAVTPPVELRRFEAAAIHPLPPLVAARCRLAALLALALDGEGAILLLDGDRLPEGDPALALEALA